MFDPDVDEARKYLLENLAGVGAAAIEQPRTNLTGDPYFTDG